MDKLQQCAKEFEKLFDIEYEFKLGRKGKITEFVVFFSKQHFFHLIGLHKLKDLNLKISNAEKIFDKVISGEITYDYIKKSVFFDKIESRIDGFIHFSDFLDDETLTFKYNDKACKWSSIKAKYILENTVREYYLFIDKSEETDSYQEMFCRSFFKKDDNYTKCSTRMTVLYKAKVNVLLKEKIVLIDKLKKE